MITREVEDKIAARFPIHRLYPQQAEIKQA